MRFAVSAVPLLSCAWLLACSAQDASVETALGEGALSSSDYVVNGHTLNKSERAWVDFVATEVVPHLPGSHDEQLTMAARGLWWTLKEGDLEPGNWGSATSPIGYDLCNTTSGDRHIGPLDSCSDRTLARDQTLYGRAWQVGIAGVQVPGKRIDQTEALALSLYPGETIESLLEQTAALAGYPPGGATSRSIVSSVGPLRLSWLLRIPAVGLVEAVTNEVVPECIQGSMGYCYGSSWDETRMYAPSKPAALGSIADLRRILVKELAAGGGSDAGAPSSGGAGCHSATLGEDVAPLTCVQSTSNEIWYQCEYGAWHPGVTGSTGPYGECSSLHPL